MACMGAHGLWRRSMVLSRMVAGRSMHAGCLGPLCGWYLHGAATQVHAAGTIQQHSGSRLHAMHADTCSTWRRYATARAVPQSMMSASTAKLLCMNGTACHTGHHALHAAHAGQNRCCCAPLPHH